MTMRIGPMFFHHTTRVHAYSIPNGISLHVEHEGGQRWDQVAIFHCPQALQILDMFPAPQVEEPTNVFSPIPALHHPVLEDITPNRIRFEETTLRFFT